MKLQEAATIVLLVADVVMAMQPHDSTAKSRRGSDGSR